MRLIAILAGLAIASAVVGCRDSTPTDPDSDIRGTYRLETNNGRPLPDTIPGRYGSIIHGRVLEIMPGGQFTIVTTYQPYEYMSMRYGFVGTYPSQGTYRRLSAHEVEWAEQAAGVEPTVARVSGGRLEIGSAVYVRTSQ